MPNYIVLDTNILLLDANNLDTIAKSNPSSTIIIPDVVIDEIDSKKTAIGELGYQARAFGRIMAKGTLIAVYNHSDRVETTYRINDFDVLIVSFNDYEACSNTQPNLVNDRKIIHAAKSYNATLISNDVMCRIRAIASGISAIEHRQVESVDIEFSQSLTVSPDVFKSLHHTSILDLDPYYKPNYYYYTFTNSDDQSTKVGIIVNNNVQIIGKDRENDLRNQLINPKNLGQLVLSAFIQDTTTDITVCESLAGSGKTLSAMSNAMKLVDNGHYNSIIYIRNTVDDLGSPDEEIGFLSGNEEKLAVYLQPFYDTVDTIARYRYRKSSIRGADFERQIEAESKRLITEYSMSPIVALGLRGRTFDNSVIIIDEAQNISKPTMQKVLSRVGKNSKVVVLGSLKQIDSKYLTKFNSGLSVLLNATTQPNLPIKLNAVTLTKVLRSQITEFAETLFSKGDHYD